MPTKDDPRLTVRWTAEEFAAVTLLAARWGVKPSAAVRRVVMERLRAEVGDDARPLATATADRSVGSVRMPRRGSGGSPVPSSSPGPRTLLEVTKAEIARELSMPVHAPVVGTKALARIRRAGDDPGRRV